MITKYNVISLLETNDVIIQSYVYSYKNKKYWKIIKPIEIELSFGEVIVIPEGFYYDMATVPKWLWSFSRPFNDGLIGYLIHDYLYINKDKHNFTRTKVDSEMLFWTNLTNPKSIDNYIKYFFVRIFGWIWWNS